MDADLKEWNLQDTNTFLDRTLKKEEVEIPGNDNRAGLRPGHRCAKRCPD